MSDYRRAYKNGGTYFFTVVTHQRQPLLLEEQSLHRLKAAFRHTIQKYPFSVEGLVILPDHLHCIWTLPPSDNDFSIRWRLIKRYFSIGLAGLSDNKRREKNIWQKRFWEHLIQDEDDFQRSLNYLHYNPVKHGYVARPIDWHHSTFKHCVQKGYYDMDWGNEAQPFIISAQQGEFMAGTRQRRFDRPTVGGLVDRSKFVH